MQLRRLSCMKEFGWLSLRMGYNLAYSENHFSSFLDANQDVPSRINMPVSAYSQDSRRSYDRLSNCLFRQRSNELANEKRIEQEWKTQEQDAQFKVINQCQLRFHIISYCFWHVGYNDIRFLFNIISATNFALLQEEIKSNEERKRVKRGKV